MGLCQDGRENRCLVGLIKLKRMFYIWIVVVVAQAYTMVKTQTKNLKWVHLSVCNLYLNKAGWFLLFCFCFKAF